MQFAKSISFHACLLKDKGTFGVNAKFHMGWWVQKADRGLE